MDAVGNEILLGSIVVTSYMGSQIRAYEVVGFTPQKVRLGVVGGGRNRRGILC